VAVVALSGLVVVTKYANTSRNKCQSVFEPMFRTGSRPWQAPNDNFNEGVFGEHVALAV
jgi:hypothetical protein